MEEHNFEKVSKEEYILFPVCLEVGSSILLLLGIHQMYVGIEINHPVYGILFGNLMFALVSSLINIFVFPFLTNFKYSALVNANITIYFLFHDSCWCVLSVLRYFYIIHKNWLHDKFPEAKTILILASFGIFTIFTICFFSVLGPLVAFGWPKIKVFDMPLEAKIIGLSLILGNLIFLLGTSCIFYIMILGKRGKFCINKVSPIEQEVSENSEASINCELENLEINAAILSLETNFVLCAIGFATFILVTISSDNLVVIVLILIKGLTPIFTTIANFGKIQQLIVSCYEKLKVIVCT